MVAAAQEERLGGNKFAGMARLLVRLRGAESEGCKSPPGRRLLPET